MDQLPESITTLTPQEITDLRARAKTDKLFLATAVLGMDHQADVHQELFDQFIQYDGTQSWVEQSRIKKRLILWFRGSFKSSSVVVDVVQAILNFPNIRILLMQGSLKTTKRLLREIASHFMGDARGSRLAELFPEFCAAKKRDLALTAESFVTPARTRKQLQQATVTVASPKAVKTGQHYELLYADDLVNDSNYRSETLLEKTWQDYTMCLPLLDPPYYVVMTGTRYAHTDIYARIILQNEVTKEWVISIKTCWNDAGTDVRFPRRETTDGRYVGTTREELLQLKQTDPGVYASQYLMQPASTARQTFSEEQLEGRLILPSLAPESLSKPFMFVDLASGNNDRSDDCVILLGRVDHLGKMYVTFGRGGQWDTHALASHILDVCFRSCAPDDRPQMIYLEKSAAGKVYVDFFRMYCANKGVTLPLDFLPADNQADAKRIRVEALNGYFAQNRLFFFHGLECWPKMKDQFLKWSGEKGQHDDYPDTVALLAQYFARNTAHIQPLSAERYPFLRMMEQYGSPLGVPDPVSPQRGLDYEGMGDWFAG